GDVGGKICPVGKLALFTRGEKLTGKEIDHGDGIVVQAQWPAGGGQLFVCTHDADPSDKLGAARHALIDPTTGKKTPFAIPDGYYPIDLSPGGKHLLAFGPLDQKKLATPVFLLATDGKAEPIPITGHKEHAFAVRFDPTGTKALIASRVPDDVRVENGGLASSNKGKKLL